MTDWRTRQEIRSYNQEERGELPECPDCEGTGFQSYINEDNELVDTDRDCVRCFGDGRIDPYAESLEWKADNEIEYGPDPF